MNRIYTIIVLMLLSASVYAQKSVFRHVGDKARKERKETEMKAVEVNEVTSRRKAGATLGEGGELIAGNIYRHVYLYDDNNVRKADTVYLKGINSANGEQEIYTVGTYAYEYDDQQRIVSETVTYSVNRKEFAPYCIQVDYNDETTDYTKYEIDENGNRQEVEKWSYYNNGQMARHAVSGYETEFTPDGYVAKAGTQSLMTKYGGGLNDSIIVRDAIEGDDTFVSYSYDGTIGKLLSYKKYNTASRSYDEEKVVYDYDSLGRLVRARRFSIGNGENINIPTDTPLADLEAEGFVEPEWQLEEEETYTYYNDEVYAVNNPLRAVFGLEGPVKKYTFFEEGGERQDWKQEVAFDYNQAGELLAVTATQVSAEPEDAETLTFKVDNGQIAEIWVEDASANAYHTVYVWKEGKIVSETEEYYPGSYNPEQDVEMHGLSSWSSFPGNVLTITGRNFGNDPSIVKVMIGGKSAPIVRVQGEYIKCVVPYGTPGGKVEVLVGTGDQQKTAFTEECLHVCAADVTTLCGNKDSQGWITGSFETCAGFRNYGVMQFSPYNKNQLFIVYDKEPNWEEQHAIQLLDFEKRTVEDVLPASLFLGNGVNINVLRLRTIDFAKDPFYYDKNGNYLGRLADQDESTQEAFKNDTECNRWSEHLIVSVDAHKSTWDAPSVYIVHRDKATGEFNSNSKSILLCRYNQCNGASIHPINGELYFTSYTEGQILRCDMDAYWDAVEVTVGPDVNEPENKVIHWELVTWDNVASKNKTGNPNMHVVFPILDNYFESQICMHPSGDYAYIIGLNRSVILRTDYNWETKQFMEPYIVAGTPGVNGTTDGAGESARFYLPYQGVFTVNPDYVAEGKDDIYDFYFAERGNDAVRRLSPDGYVTKVLFSVGDIFDTPTGIAARQNHNVLDADGNPTTEFYVLDSKNCRICTFSYKTGTIDASYDNTVETINKCTYTYGDNSVREYNNGNRIYTEEKDGRWYQRVNLRPSGRRLICLREVQTEDVKFKRPNALCGISGFAPEQTIVASVKDRIVVLNEYSWNNNIDDWSSTPDGKQNVYANVNGDTYFAISHEDNQTICSNVDGDPVYVLENGRLVKEYQYYGSYALYDETIYTYDGEGKLISKLIRAVDKNAAKVTEMLLEYKYNTATGILTPEISSTVGIEINGRHIGIAEGQTFNVCTLDGKLIAQNTMSYTFPKQGVYIIKVGTASMKVSIR